MVQWYPGDNGLFVSSGADGQLKVWDANVLSTPVESFALGRRIYCHHISGINPSCVAVGTETNHVRIGTYSKSGARLNFKRLKCEILEFFSVGLKSKSRFNSLFYFLKASFLARKFKLENWQVLSILSLFPNFVPFSTFVPFSHFFPFCSILRKSISL